MRAYAKHIILLWMLFFSGISIAQNVPDSTRIQTALDPAKEQNPQVSDKTETVSDSTKNRTNSFAQDSILLSASKAATSKSSESKPNKQKIDAPISYTSKDSMVLMGNGTAYLHGSGEVRYEKMELTSEYIRMHMDSSLIFAKGVQDTVTEEWKGKPVFKDGKDSYESDEITYNIKTQKGFIRHVVTEQGEGFIISDKTKKVDNNTMLMAGGKYTTCDDHEHPHFYLKLTKAKVKPGDYIATGPAYMVVGDVPLPLAIPFGFFPFTNKYSSGLIMPTFGDDATRGLYLQGLGYYFAINDYMDLQITGDIYTRGTWGIRAQSKYIKRYAFSGNVNINYRTDITGEKDMPDYQKSTNFSVQWTHTQDAKANPYANFSASVNFSTSGYNRSNINSYYNPTLTSENTKSSSISYTQRFPDSPWSLSLTASVSQRTKDSTMSLQLPTLSVNMSRIYPFKRKHPVGKQKWYEKISMSYTGNGQIAVNNIREDKILKSNFLRDWQTGLKHYIPISASFMLFKYLSITPSINLTDRMYFQRVNQTWDEQQQGLQRDTTNGFYNVFDFDVGVSMSTKLYVFYTPLKSLFPKSKVEKFRQTITPTLSFNYHPDFGTAWWGYYGSYDQPVYTDQLDANGKKIQKVDDSGNPVFVKQTYSHYPGAIYGNTSQGASGTLTFGLATNVEMKMINSKDTTGTNPYKLVSILDNLSINGAYNFVADSMNWSNFNVNLRIKIPKVNYTINLSGAFDPYMYELNALGTPVRTNKQYWHNGRFPHFLGTQASLSYTFNNDTFKKWFGKDKKKKDESKNMDPIEVGDDGMAKNGKLSNSHKHDDDMEFDEDGFVKTEIPWSLSVSYSIRYGSGSEFDYDKMYYKMIFTHNLSFSGTLGLGHGWKVSAGTSYDFRAHQFSSANFNVSRDLHCWNMTASFVPFGPYKSYTFHIGVNASMLSDLKYDKNSNQSTNARVNWW